MRRPAPPGLLSTGIEFVLIGTPGMSGSSAGGAPDAPSGAPSPLGSARSRGSSASGGSGGSGGSGRFQRWRVMEQLGIPSPLRDLAAASPAGGAGRAAAEERGLAVEDL